MGESDTTTLDVVTLAIAIAIAGVLLAALSLGWQAATFFLSGSRVKTTLRLGALRRELGMTTRMTGPLNMTESAAALIRDQGFTEPVLVVEVRNRGRLAVSVEDVTATTDDGFGFNRMADPENPPVPYRLEPGAKESWHVDVRPLQMLAESDPKPRLVRMAVELGNGKVVLTKQTLRLGPPR